MSRVVVLVGMMGSGKSTVGRLLADRIGARFIDTDDLVEAKVGKSVRDIFADDGEAVFRQHESAALREALDSPGDLVVAAAGGVVLAPANRTLIDERANTTIWLDAVHHELRQRVQQGEHRPLLDGDVDTTLAVLRKERESLYESVADLRIDTSALTAEEVVPAIEHFLTRERVS